MLFYGVYMLQILKFYSVISFDAVGKDCLLLKHSK